MNNAVFMALFLYTKFILKDTMVMSAKKWSFQKNGRSIELQPPEDVPPGTSEALTDFIFAEIGRSTRNLANYRSIWERETSENESGRGLSGNMTSQTLDEDGNVLLESLYDRWDTVKITRAQFEKFLDEFAEYLRTSQDNE